MPGGGDFQFTVSIALQHTTLEIKATRRFLEARSRAYALTRGQAAGGVAAQFCQ